MFELAILTATMIAIISAVNLPLTFQKLKIKDKEQFILTPSPTTKVEYKVENENNDVSVTKMCACPTDYENKLRLPQVYCNKLLITYYLWLIKNGSECETTFCTMPVESVFLQHDHLSCENEGTIGEIGYEKYSHWFSMLIVCNHMYKETLYLKHRIRYPLLLTDSDKKEKTDFSKYKHDLKKYKNLNKIYALENQKIVFHQFFGDKISTYFSNPSEDETEKHKYFVMKQLIEDSDMVGDVWKQSTYQYFNTAPMWYTISEGSWKKINNYIRKQMKDILDEEVIIYSGISQKSLSIGGKYVLLSHENQSIRIPEHFWKVIFDEKLKRAIALIVHNDLQFSLLKKNIENGKPSESKKVCDDSEDLCAINGWYVSEKNDEKGYTYCCNMDNNVKKKLGLHDSIPEVDILDLNNYMRHKKDNKWKPSAKRLLSWKLLSFNSSNSVDTN